MPVVGQPSRFAVEYDLNENHGGAWMFGRFCYWIGGRQVGEYDLGTSLRDVLFQLELAVARNKGLRSSRRFNARSAVDVFRLLHAALFGAADLNNAEVAVEEQWARHDIVPPVDVFDSWKCFLVEDEQTSRLFFARQPYLEVTEIELTPGEVDAVLKQAVKALDNIHEHQSRGRATFGVAIDE